DERVDHRLAEQLAPIECVMRQPELVAHAAGVVLVFGRATTPGVPFVHVVPEVQRDADDLVAALREQSRCHRRVDAAAHAHDDASHATWANLSTWWRVVSTLPRIEWINGRMRAAP